MWTKLEESANEDETLGNSFYTNGLFKITNEEKVRVVVAVIFQFSFYPSARFKQFKR